MLKKIFITSILVSTLTGCKEEQTTKESDQEFSLNYEKFTLDNGLEVILHEDHSDPIVAVATVMHVGSNREKPGRTGFAHFFEHMSFNDSENVPRGANRKLIPEWGGTRNGGTWSDGTIYYEVVPKDAFEKILWIDSDRFGYMINTVTKEALEREKQVVKNEKRERVDNAPYGFTDEVIRKHLYPEGHPYSWTVIGSLPDLQAATLEDVKEFYEQYYGAGNASLVIAGDIDVAKTKELVQQWFGEIRKGPEVEAPKPMPVSLDTTKALYFEDNFAKLPELRMVYPTVENYNKDLAALEVLGNLLSGSKKSPLYQVLVEEKKLAPSVGTYQNGQEIAGEFVFRVRANAGVPLDSVKAAIAEGLKRFETEGVSATELQRIKAELETSLYAGIETVLNKAFTLVQDNEFAGDPAQIIKTAEATAAVTAEDVMRVYGEYIKDKPYVMTSFVPKGSPELAVSGSQLAEVYIEKVEAMDASEEVSAGEEAQYEKTPSTFDRSEPAFGDLPKFKMPEIWTDTLDNTGVAVLGIESKEVPLVTFDITIPGGHQLDPLEKAGVASLMTRLMMQGTATRTPAELEEAIGLLGASINIYSSNEEIRVTGYSLAKNFAPTVALAQEMLLQPRWDETEYDRLKKALETQLKGDEANPQSIARNNFIQLLYGKDNILGIPSSGTPETATHISLQDLKDYYNTYISPANATIHVAGMVTEDQVEAAFASLDQNWKKKAVDLPSVEVAQKTTGGTIYFIDFPGAKQTVIYGGKLALDGKDPNYAKLNFANEVLGGGSSGQLFQTLRIEKGYTYGAYSYVQQAGYQAPFVVSSSVRANATKASMEIIEGLLSNYANQFGEGAVEITRNKVLKGSLLDFEGLSAKLGILRDISKYDKSFKYIEENQAQLLNMKPEDFKEIITTYMKEDDMIYLLVGDKATQWQEVQQLGKPVVELDIYGNVL